MTGLLAFLMLPTLLIVFVIEAAAWFNLAVLREFRVPWLALIPVVNRYMMGYIGDGLIMENKDKKPMPYLAVIFLCFTILNLMSGFVPMPIYAVWLFAVGVAVMRTLVGYLIFNRYYPKKILFTLVCAVPLVGWIGQPILIFRCIRDDMAELEAPYLKKD